MKFAYMSDLHFEFGQSTVVDKLPVADAILLAGDLKAAPKCVCYDDFMSKAREKYGDCNVFEIDGNHTAYGGTADAFTNKQFAVETKGVMVIGCTLWSGKDSSYAYNNFLNDSNIPGFTWERMHKQHCSDVAFIKQNLTIANSKGIKTVVMTHHMPHWDCVDDIYKGQGKDGINLGFYTDLDWLIKDYHPNVWVCGHTHTSFDIKVHTTRIVCNPRGYPAGCGVFENDVFNQYATFEV